MQLRRSTPAPAEDSTPPREAHPVHHLDRAPLVVARKEVIPEHRRAERNCRANEDDATHGTSLRPKYTRTFTLLFADCYVTFDFVSGARRWGEMLAGWATPNSATIGTCSTSFATANPRTSIRSGALTRPAFHRVSPTRGWS